MELELPDEIKEIKNMIKKFVEKELLPIDDKLEEENEVPPEIIDKLKELGIFGVTIPQEFGGQGLNMLTWCNICEELAKAHIIFRPLTYTNDIGSVPLVKFANEQQKRKYLPRIAAGELTPAFALTEEVAGSDIGAIKTVAIKQVDKFVINGKKNFIAQAEKADIFYVFAKVDDKISCFIVEKELPGVVVLPYKKSLIRAFDEREIIFNEVTIPVENLVSSIGDGLKIALSTIDAARLAISAWCVGAAEYLINLSVNYAQQRIQFGKPIADNQAIQWMLADAKVELQAARYMVYDAAIKYDNQEVKIEEISSCKLFSTEMVNRVADYAVQIHGGTGVMKETPTERFYRAARVFRVLLGTSEIQRLTIARSLFNNI